jgi:hypothetical protein
MNAVKSPIPKVIPVKTKGVIQLTITAKPLFLALQIRICFVIESIMKMTICSPISLVLSADTKFQPKTDLFLVALVVHQIFF